MKLRRHIPTVLIILQLSHLASAAEYTWTNTTSNGWLGSTNGYSLTSSGNWNTTPTFNNTTTLNFSSSDGQITIAAPFGTTTVNKMVFSSGNGWRFNSGSATINFDGTTPTLDVQSGYARLEFKASSSNGITKTASGTIQSNFQSVSSGFTGPLTIAAGTWQAMNNYALAEEKTVNVLSGATLNMSSLALGSSAISGGTTASRGYTINIAGDGSGSGAITSLANVMNGLSGIKHLALTDDASVGTSASYDIGYNGGSISGAGHTLTKRGSGTIWMRAAATNISYNVAEGTLVANASNDALGGAAGSVSVASGAILASSGNMAIATPLTMDSGSTLTNLTGSTSWSGSVSLQAGDGVTFTGASAATTITAQGVISGEGGTLIKAGGNTLNLNNTNTYTGLTKITQGTLSLGSAGSINQSSEIQISNGATFNVSTVSGGYSLGSAQTLSGGGTVAGATIIEGTHSPGFSPGIQSFTSDLTYSDGSIIIWELIDNMVAGRGTNYDGINVTGDLTFNGSVTLDLTFALASSNVDWTDAFWSGYVSGANGWKVFDVGGTITGLDNINLPLGGTLLDSNGTSLLTARSQGFFYLSEQNDGVYLNYAVPEPTSVALGGLGLLLTLRRRRS
jgi:fibronectin-binding autotransporter adhesin